MSQRKWFSDQHNKVKLELKKVHRSRTGESPDRLDTLIMLFGEWSMPKQDVKTTPDYIVRLGNEIKKQDENRAGAFAGLLAQPDTWRIGRK